MMVIMVMRLIRLKMDNSELWSDIGQSYIIRLKMDNSELWSDIGQSYISICQATFVAKNVQGLLCHRRFQGAGSLLPPPLSEIRG